MSDELAYTCGHVAFYRAVLTEMIAEQGLAALESEQGALFDALYARERAHRVKVCSVMLTGDVQFKLVTEAKRLGETLGRALDQIFDALELDDRQRGLIPLKVPPLLRALSLDCDDPA